MKHTRWATEWPKYQKFSISWYLKFFQELRSIPECLYPYEQKAEHICINPYHYQKIENPNKVGTVVFLFFFLSRTCPPRIASIQSNRRLSKEWNICKQTNIILKENSDSEHAQGNLIPVLLLDFGNFIFAPIHFARVLFYPENSGITIRARRLGQLKLPWSASET